jgi:hypothetical protein
MASGIRWRAGGAAVVLFALMMTQSAHAYSHFAVAAGGRLKWNDSRVRWFATDGGTTGISRAAFQAALARAFATWEAVPTATIGFDFVGFTSAEPFEDDGLSVLGFQDQPDLERILGATTFVTDVVTGELIESDIFFNSAFPWSTAGGGDAASFDLESVAVHEIGHFIGLGHSALGETEVRPEGGRRVFASGAVMFPISLGRGVTADRDLQPDDIAGVSDLYPEAGFRAGTGGVHGRVRRDRGAVIGAHVVAFNIDTGTLVAGFSLGDGGEFQIAGLEPGAYVIRAEPLDDADLESFFSSGEVDVDFQVTFHARLIVAPAGGVGERFDVIVRPK